MLFALLTAALAGPAGSPSGYAQAHADIAHVLGHVSVHCPVGAEVRGRLVGQFSQRIHNGWYSNVETRRSGTHVIETQINKDKVNPEYESRLRVRWSASEPGEAVRCTIEPITRVPVTIVVRNAEGKPVAGTHVYGCGLSGDTGPDGVLSAMAYDHATCRLRTTADRVRYTFTFDPDEHAGTEVRLAPTPQEPSDYDPAANVAEYRNLLEIYEGMAPMADTPEAHRLYRHLIKHRKGMVDLALCHAGDLDACERKGPILGRQPTPMRK